jgi:hypothetical protein
MVPMKKCELIKFNEKLAYILKDVKIHNPKEVIKLLNIRISREALYDLQHMHNVPMPTDSEIIIEHGVGFNITNRINASLNNILWGIRIQLHHIHVVDMKRLYDRL